MILRKLHRDALEYVNICLIKEGKDPIEDFPMGLRFDDGQSPIGKLLGGEELSKPLSSDDVDLAINVFAGGTHESAILWTALFYAGFYRKYNEALLYGKLPLTRRQRLVKTLRSAPGDIQETYLRTKLLVSYVRGELPALGSGRENH